MRDWASELRAIADGRLMLNVRNGVTVSRSMLAMIADEIDALRAAPLTPAEVGGHADAQTEARAIARKLQDVIEGHSWRLNIDKATDIIATALAAKDAELEQYLTDRDAELSASFDAGHYRAMSEHATPWRIRAERAEAELARRDMQLEASAKVALDLSAQLAEARKALNAGEALSRQLHAVIDRLNGQAYSSTLSALNYFDAARRALEAQGGVKVGALAWKERVGVDGTFDAYTSIGHYIATITDDDRGMWFVVGLTQSNYCAPDIDIVKAAAQADYERRILSALTTEPAAPEGRREAVRIGDAVLDWMVKFDLLDAGNEYYVSDVLAVLNDLTPSTRPAEQAVTEAKPVAFRVHDFHVARIPMKARGKFDEPTEYFYPASRENDARETARIMGATCTPLYAGKESE